MDRATERRFRAAMTAPRTGGMCKYCAHPVVKRHVGDWCADCEETGLQCGAVQFRANKAYERATRRVTR